MSAQNHLTRRHSTPLNRNHKLLFYNIYNHFGFIASLCCCCCCCCCCRRSDRFAPFQKIKIPRNGRSPLFLPPFDDPWAGQLLFLFLSQSNDSKNILPLSLRLTTTQRSVISATNPFWGFFIGGRKLGEFGFLFKLRFLWFIIF